MKSIRMAIGLAIVLLVPSIASAQSHNIYSWTDENGVKHFSDKAPANVEASSQKIAPDPQAKDSGTPADPADLLNNQAMETTVENTTTAEGSGEELSYADQQRKAMADRREADQQRRAEREQLCLKARDQLARIEPSRRVFYTDEEGNSARMDDEERVRMVEKSKNEVDEYCD